MVLALGCEAGQTAPCGGCAQGAVCNPQTGVCEFVASCLPTTPLACGGSSDFCQNGSCQQCPSGTLNCDGVGECECAGSCNGTACQLGNTCQANTPFGCSGTMGFCQNGSCQQCPSGMLNCDGLGECECAGSCSGTICETGNLCQPTAAFACGQNTSFCQNGSCQQCPSGMLNCDGVGDCECGGSCNGSACQSGRPCDPQTAKSCEYFTLYCNAGSCGPCPAGRFNCDGVGDCECQTGCSGASCSTGPGNCDPKQPNTCANAQAYCDINTCRLCPQGIFNCDGVGECECSGTCLGYQCDTSTSCQEWVFNSCGAEGLYCFGNRCMPCSPGLFNCDGTYGCECQNGCNGSACGGGGCSASVAHSCGNSGLYCQGGICTSCPGGSANCDGINNCECFGSCQGALCGS